MYTTTETQGTVKLCAFVVSHSGGAPEAFNITATTRDGTAGTTNHRTYACNVCTLYWLAHSFIATVAGLDYVKVVGREFVFNRRDIRVCHNIDILQDSDLELVPNEFFFIDLSYVSGVQPIIIDPATAQVVIDDSAEPECSCEFNSTQ